MSKTVSKTLSCFVDESGDFGVFKPHCPFYLVSIVLHAQETSIRGNILRLENILSQNGLFHHTFHAGPLLRREKPYQDDTLDDRRRLFNCLLNFARQIPIRILSVSVKKSDCINYDDLVNKLKQNLEREIARTRSFWESFDKIILYYDNGQKALKGILYEVFATAFNTVDVRTIHPADYRLFQVADLVCTIDLIKAKADSGIFSKSEVDFFQGKPAFIKNYWRKLASKRL